MSVKDIDIGKIETEIKCLIKAMDEEEIQIIKAISIETWIIHLGERFNYLANNCPNLFEIVLQSGSNFDFGILREFFQIYQKVRDGKITQEMGNKAIEKFGRKKWIDPILNSEEFQKYKETPEYKKEVEARSKNPDAQKYLELIGAKRKKHGKKLKKKKKR